MPPELQLSQRISQGDRQAQRELYDRYAGVAMATALRYVADGDAARDVLHNAFVKILSAPSRYEYRGEGSLRAWILRIVSNEAIDYLKQKARLDYRDDLPDDVPDDEPSVGQVPLEVLQALIEQLPIGYRTVFCLYVFDQLSHKEIARRLGIKENTSASQFHRAKRMLAQMINNYQKQQSR